MILNNHYLSINYIDMKNNNPNHRENIQKWHIKEIVAEINERVDVRDYNSMLEWVMVQPEGKIKYLLRNGSDVPIIVKNVASCFLQDLETGKSYMLQECLNRVLGKPKQESEVKVSDSNLTISVDVHSENDKNNIDKLIK